MNYFLLFEEHVPHGAHVPKMEVCPIVVTYKRSLAQVLFEHLTIGTGAAIFFISALGKVDI